MIKDIENNYAFVHIPSTGSSIVSLWFNMLSQTESYSSTFQYFVRKDRQWFLDQQFSIKLEPTSDNDHLDNDQIAKQVPFYFLKHQPAKYNDDPNLKLYTIIRNPYERLLSQYFFLISPHRSLQQYRLMLPTSIGNNISADPFEQTAAQDQLKTFGSYVEWMLEDDINQPIKQFLLKSDQYNFTHDDEGNNLIDTYIRWESSNDDWNILATKLNYPKDIFDVEVDWTTPSPLRDKHYSFFYDDQIKEQVDRLVYRDCKTFNYQFEWK